MVTCEGMVSTAKIWRHIAFGVITYKVVMMPDLTYDIIAVYLIAIAGVELGQQFTPSAKFKAAQKYDITTTPEGGMTTNDKQ